MIDHSKPPCPECGSYDTDSHTPFCSQQTIEQLRKQVKIYYDAWLTNQNSYTHNRRRMNEEITKWRGKNAILRHENNQLRKKLSTYGLL